MAGGIPSEVRELLGSNPVDKEFNIKLSCLLCDLGKLLLSLVCKNINVLKIKK